MRIGIDCRTILHPEKGEGAGLGHYTYQLVRHLLKVDKKNTYFLFFDRSVQKRRLDKFKQKNVLIRFFPFLQYKNLMPEGLSHLLVNATLDREKLDVFHSPDISLPRSYPGTSIITVHDLAFYKFPELTFPEKSHLLKTIVPNIFKEAKKVIAVSKSTAKDLQEIFNLDAKKIEVIYHGIDQRFFKKRTLSEIKKIKKKYNIQKDYLFFLGTLESRKNIMRIIEAYERFRDQLIRPLSNTGKKIKISQNIFSKYQLVLAGAKGFDFKKIKKKIADSEYKNDIILPGYVEADDLGALFGGASLFVFPSLYEGFGLPILEAMAKGIPILSSNISSIPEVTQNAAALVDPYNVAQIAQVMYTLLGDKNLQKKLITKGQTRVKNFTWEKCARKTLGVYMEINKG